MTEPFKASIRICDGGVEIIPAYNDRDILAFANLFEVLEYVGRERIQITLIEYAENSRKQEADLIASRIVGYQVPVGAASGTSSSPIRVEFIDPQSSPRFAYERRVVYDPIRKHPVIKIVKAAIVAAMYVRTEQRITKSHQDFWAKEVSREDIQAIQDRLVIKAESADLRRKIATLEASLVEAELEASLGIE